jgi:Signal transduction histidine kinase
MENNGTLASLKQRIEELEKENALLRRDFSSVFNGPSVTVPSELKPLFDKAQQTVSEYFTNLKMDPAKGTIEINDQRYVLVRASALSKDFLDTIKNLYADRGEAEAMAIGKNFLFDIAHVIGMNDAREFHQRMNLVDPISKLSAGPLHFAYSGWAFVEILAESNPTPDENFYLAYHHPYSFEADSWKRSGKLSDSPVCIMNAGYSSGWCEESFGIPLTAVEISCTARGDDKCTFIMSTPDKIKQHVEKFTSRGQNLGRKQYDIPTFFDRKRVEEEMQRSRQLAEESAKMKSDFVANMSHELRTPLTAILGFTDLLSKTDLNAVQKEYLQAVRRSGSNLLSIINDILDLSKLDAGKLVAEQIPFNLRDIVQDIRTMFAPKAAEKGLVFRVDAAPVNDTFCGDPMRLTQVLVNLTGNAIKFTEEGEVNIEINVQQEDEKNIWIRFAIRDTGIGIPEEKMATIFERFTQADTDTTRKYGGTGLGLAITSQLVGLMEGSILVHRNKPKGTVFVVELPFAKTVTTHTIDKPTLELPDFDRSKMVLVVEDNLINRRLTTLMLQNNDIKFIEAENGEQAIQILKEQKVDLILMDLQMPVMDGYQATCIIREQLNIHIPIIATTAHALAEERERCFDLGVNDYLSKPFTESDLVQKIAKWLANTKKTIGVIDLSFLVKQTRNNRTIIEEMINLFKDQTLEETSVLEQAIRDEDYGKIYKAAHMLRNAISLVGLSPLIGQFLLETEQWAHGRKNMDGIRNHFEKIKEVCTKAVKELESKELTELLQTTA